MLALGAGIGVTDQLFSVHYGHFELWACSGCFLKLLLWPAEWSNSSQATPSLTKAACWSAANLSLELPLPTEYSNVAFSTLAAGALHVCGIVSNSSEPWHTGDVLCWIPELNDTRPAQPAPLYPLSCIPGQYIFHPMSIKSTPSIL